MGRPFATRHVARLLLAAAMAFSGLAARAETPQPQVVRMGYVSGIAFPTLLVAESRGYFLKNGLAVEKTPLSGSGPVSEAVAAGNLDIGNTSPTTSIIAAARRAKTVMVSGFEETFTEKSGKSWEAVFVVVRAGEGVKTLEDLRGKRIAVNDIGSSYNYFLRARYLQEGINPDKDVSIIPMPFAQMAGALVQKQVDAVIASADGYQQAKQRVAVELIGTHTSLEQLDVGLSSSLAVNTDFFRAHRQSVVLFLKSLLEARLWMEEAIARHDPAFYEIVDKAMKFSPERSKFFWETRGGYYGRELPFVNRMDITRRLVDRQLSVLKIDGIVKQDLTYEQVVDIAPLKEAYALLNLPWDEAKH